MYKPRYLLYALGAILLLVIATKAYASSLTERRLGALTTDNFCSGVREDGTRYDDFILARNSGSTLRISENHACRWLDGVKDAQLALCGETTIVKPELCDKHKKR